MPTSSYSPSVAGRIVSLVGGLLLTVVAAILIPRLVIGGYFKYHVVWVLFAVFIAILVIGAAITVVRVFVTGPVFISTTPTHVTLHRGPRAAETWARDEVRFSSFVVRQTTNGIPSGSTRKLIVDRPGERIEVPLTWYSASTFNALIADVAPLVPAEAPTATAAPIAAPTVSSGTFALDPAPLRRTRTTAIVIIIVGVVVGFALFGLLLDEGDLEIAAFLAPVFAAPFIAIGVGLLLRDRAVPQQVAVSPSTLSIDDRTFSIGQLSSIVATPASYENPRGRILTLRESTGQRTVVRLGRTRSFPDYGQFLEALRGATAHRPGLFTLDVA